MKRTIYLSWRFSLRDRLQVCTHLESTEAFLGNVRHHSCILPWPPWAHWYLPERSSYTCLEVWFIEMLPKGHLQISWSEGQRAYEYGPQDYIFAYFKTCSPSIWLSNSLKLSTKWDPSPWNTEKSWHTFNNRNLSRINQAVRQSQRFKRQPTTRARLNYKLPHIHKASTSRHREVTISPNT